MATSATTTQWLQRGAWWFVLIWASVMRLGWWGVGSFASDEARLSWLALRMARGGELITSGITSSAGARNLPASVYAFVPPYAISTDPLVATLFVGVLNVLAVWGVMHLAYHLALQLGANDTRAHWAGIGAGLFLASHPFAVFFSRNIWTQNLLLPMAVALLVLVWLADRTQGKRRWWAILSATLVAGVAFQVHLAGISLLLVWALAVWQGRWWRGWLARSAVLVGIVLSALTLAPFLISALTTSPHYITEYTQALGEGERALTTLAGEHTLRIAVGYDWNYLALGELGDVGEANAILALSTGAVLLLGGGLLLAQIRHAERRAPIWMVMLVIVAPILVFSLGSTPPRLHYALGALAGFALLVGVTWAHEGRFLRWGAIVITLIITSIWSVQSITSLMQISGKTAPNGLGATLQSVRDPIQSAIADAKQEGGTDTPLIILTQSDDIATRGEPATWAVLAWDDVTAQNARILGGWYTLILPTANTDTPFTLLTDVDGMPAWEEAQFWADTYDAELTAYTPHIAPPIYRWHFAGISDDALPDAYTRLDTPIVFESGLTLIAYQTRLISGRYRVSLVYRVEAIPEGRTIQQFTHLRLPDNGDGTPDFISDLPLSKQNWREGDTLISMADFFLPDDVPMDTPFLIDTGQYRLEDGVRFGREDGEGDFVRVVLD
jgi:4-amino-4-deoxy-L-arabinose transferase-like glycosyltransferase